MALYMTPLLSHLDSRSNNLSEDSMKNLWRSLLVVFAALCTITACNANDSSTGVTPVARFLYTANQSGSQSAFSINSATGVLTPIAGSPFAGGSIPGGAAVDPLGKFA